jgi:hypothetical protein
MQCAFALLNFNFWPALLYHIIPHYLINGTNLGGRGGESIQHAMRVSIFSTNFVWNISHSKKNREMWSYMYIDLHVKYRYSCQILIKFQYSQQIFEKYSNIKFHENPYSGSRVVWQGRTDAQTNGRTDMTKQTIAFRNFENGSKICTAMSLD